jgi:circadian clock protein KaiB
METNPIPHIRLPQHARPVQEAGDKFMLQLYVSGMTENSMLAIENVKRLCEKYLKDYFELEIIDIYKNPSLAEERQIVFTPSLIKLSPFPKKTLIGRFTDLERVMVGLGIPF